MKPVNLQDMIAKTKSIDAKNIILKESRTIPVLISGYVTENNQRLATGEDLTTGEQIKVSLVTKLNENGEKKQRDMDDIELVSPAGSTVVFQNCFADEKTQVITSYYAQTPQNVELKDGQKKQVDITVQPGRLIKSNTGRIAAAIYNVENGESVTNKDALLSKAAELFANGQSVYLRVRLDVEQDGAHLKQNEAFEFYPKYERITLKDGTIKNEVDVKSSVKNLSDSDFSQLWLDNLENFGDMLGNGIEIDMVPVELVWYGVARTRDGKDIPEAKRYGLGNNSGLFAAQIEQFRNEDGQSSRKYNTTLTNLVLSKMTLEDSDGSRQMLLGVSTLSTRPTFITSNELPFYCEQSGKQYTPNPEKVFARLLKSDGTFALPKSKDAAPEEAKEQGKTNSASADELPAEKAKSPVKSAPKKESAIQAPESAQQDQVVVSQEEFAEPTHVETHVEGFDENMDFSDLDVDSILNEIDSEEVTQAVAQTMQNSM